MTDTRNAAVTYEGYLKVDELLSLQHPRSDGPEHDEMLFIIIHQVYELWFKELLHELDHVMRLLRDDEPHRAQHTLKRILTILKVMVAQLDILETMTPLEFLSFRTRLEAASGFQSAQFRQIEFVLGAKSEAVLGRFPEGSRRVRHSRNDTANQLSGTRSCITSRVKGTPSRLRISHEWSARRSNLRPRSSRSCWTSIVATRSLRRSANGWSTWTKALPSGVIGTSGWSSAPSGPSLGPAGLVARNIFALRSGGICFPISGKYGRRCS